MKVILKEDVPNLGESGSVVTVKPGYARNYLIPQGLAALATSRNVEMIEHQLREIQRQIDAAKAEASQVRERLGETSVTLTKPAGENEKLYGSVTTRDIAAALAAEGIEVDRRRIAIDEPIKSLGVYTVEIRLYGGEVGEVKVWVVKE
ncbi:MAG: 50S ribosomal protein L9 [Polyangia bacterium]